MFLRVHLNFITETNKKEHNYKHVLNMEYTKYDLAVKKCFANQMRWRVVSLAVQLIIQKLAGKKEYIWT
jgi:hypothetical protein